MDFIQHLWLPIVVSAIAVFFLSMIAWTALPHHKLDRTDAPGGDELSRRVKELGIAPGNYLFPSKAAMMADCKIPIRENPLGTITVMRREGMAKNLALSLVIYLCVSGMIAALLYPLVGIDVSSLTIFRAAGLAGVLGYSFAFLPTGLWFQSGTRMQINCLIDGIVFGLATGAVFAWLWPR
ncbi:hypothetical protein BH11PLA1_BH11PLA1_16880 [soil metagenome]